MDNCGNGPSALAVLGFIILSPILIPLMCVNHVTAEKVEVTAEVFGVCQDGCVELTMPDGQKYDRLRIAGAKLGDTVHLRCSQGGLFDDYYDCELLR